MSILPKEFYREDPARVAVKLLGKLLVRVYRGERLSGKIVETEAYYGVEDPASRARRGGNLAQMIYGDVGVALIYGVHRQWLLNVVAHSPGEAGAVLIRAVEPVEGVETMKKLRRALELQLLTSGPGRLTRAMAIDKKLHGKPVYTTAHGLWIEGGEEISERQVAVSHRIGVTEDLPVPLRFYIKGNPFVSRKTPPARL